MEQHIILLEVSMVVCGIWESVYLGVCVSGSLCIWETVCSGRLCIWETVYLGRLYLQVFLSGRLCIWKSVYLGDFVSGSPCIWNTVAINGAQGRMDPRNIPESAYTTDTSQDGSRKLPTGVAATGYFFVYHTIHSL